MSVNARTYQRSGDASAGGPGDCPSRRWPLWARWNDELDQRYTLGVEEELTLPEGNLSVGQTDHMVRGPVEALGAIGFAVGLIAPSRKWPPARTDQANRS